MLNNQLRQSNVFIWLLVTDIVLFVFMYAFRDAINEINVELTNEYEYEVVGTAEKVNLTLINELGEKEYYSKISLPYNKIFKVTGGRAYLSAQNIDSIGLVNVRIYKNGKIFKEDASYDGYATVTVMSD